MNRNSQLQLYVYSKSMKMQHLYFRCLHNTDLSIKSMFSQYNCILHILSKDFSFFWLNVNMHGLQGRLWKQVIRISITFRMSDLKIFIVLSETTDWINFSHNQDVNMCSPYQNIRILNLNKLRKLWELVAAVASVAAIRLVYECACYFISTKQKR